MLIENECYLVLNRTQTCLMNQLTLKSHFLKALKRLWNRQDFLIFLSAVSSCLRFDASRNVLNETESSDERKRKTFLTAGFNSLSVMNESI